MNSAGQVWEFVHWTRRRWYWVWVGKDLFGEVVIVRRWGSLDSHLGGKRCEPYTKRRLLAILERRRKRGYLILRGSSGLIPRG